MYEARASSTDYALAQGIKWKLSMLKNQLTVEKKDKPHE